MCLSTKRLVQIKTQKQAGGIFCLSFSTTKQRKPTNARMARGTQTADSVGLGGMGTRAAGFVEAPDWEDFADS